MVDVIGQVIGNFGKWQLRTILIIFLCKIPTSWFMAVIIYTAPTPRDGQHWCRPLASTNFTVTNPSEWIATAHPLNAKGKVDICHVYADVYENPWEYFGANQTHIHDVSSSSSSMNSRTIIPCTDIEIRSDFYSLISKFNLMCSRALLLSLSQCFHIFGLLIGGIIAYFLLKIISPRHVMLVGMVTQMICGNSTGLVNLYELHVVFRCLSAATCALMYTSGSTILADITGGKAKVITSIIFELFWSIGLILLPGLSIFFSTYSQLYIAISMPTVVLIFLHRLIPDSPRWYIRKGMIEEAKEIIIAGGTTNKREIPADLDDLLKEQAAECQREPPQANWMALWDGNPRKRHMLCVHYAWAIYILLFNSMVLNIRAYGRQYIYMNTVIIGFSEMIGVFIGMYFILYTRRRWLWSGLLSISAGCLAYLTWLIPETLKVEHIVALEMIPSIAIKIATSSSLSILTTCTVDLVPLEKKKTLMFSAAIWARGWFLWAPFIGVTKAYGTTMPLTIFATLAIVGGILTSIINHSHHKSYKKEKPQIMEEKNNVEMNSIKCGVDNKAMDAASESWTSIAEEKHI